MYNIFKWIILLSKNWYYIKLVKKGKTVIYKYAKDTYFLDQLTNGLKLAPNELPSPNSRSTYPSSSKENEVFSAEIMKLMKKKNVHSTSYFSYNDNNNNKMN